MKISMKEFAGRLTLIILLAFAMIELFSRTRLEDGITITHAAIFLAWFAFAFLTLDNSRFYVVYGAEWNE